MSSVPLKQETDMNDNSSITMKQETDMNISVKRENGSEDVNNTQSSLAVKRPKPIIANKGGSLKSEKLSNFEEDLTRFTQEIKSSQGFLSSHDQVWPRPVIKNFDPSTTDISKFMPVFSLDAFA